MTNREKKTETKEYPQEVKDLFEQYLFHRRKLDELFEDELRIVKRLIWS